ncbi:MFS general substrate transporter [Neurospora hispaniola]|uniref:MFS general substrate transporter n=1 Tax=Neurospora hispaniola TaxID=588809 RepID=A0AAJ0I3Q4_9PEZI|nr:MFS general substrate transporter [Neurospora hispaniola]
MAPDPEAGSTPQKGGWRLFGRSSTREQDNAEIPGRRRLPKWNMGILNDRETIEVPGSVLLLAADHNEPLGLRNAPARTSHSSIPTAVIRPPEPPQDEKKKTSDGKIILEPQPEESANDPLNWPTWRRDSALLSLGLFCMVGGGMTPLLAAGFTDVAKEFDVSVSSVSLTTGLYMLGMGLGSVIFSPTAILYGKRPVYLFGALLFVLTSVWCAVSKSFVSLVLGRIFQGIAVSPVECLPSATIAEIFFLHERAYRIGIYTLLLLGGKNLVPLVSAAVIESLGWRWTFWVVAMVVGFCGFLLFLFVPETFWDRVPHPRKKSSRPSFFRRMSSKQHIRRSDAAGVSVPPSALPSARHSEEGPTPAPAANHRRDVHVGFATDAEEHHAEKDREAATRQETSEKPDELHDPSVPMTAGILAEDSHAARPELITQEPSSSDNSTKPHVFYMPDNIEKPKSPYSSERFSRQDHTQTDTESQSGASSRVVGSRVPYTAALREQPAKSFVQQLKPFHGRLNKDKWHKVAIRPLILFSYPAVLWSAIVYACSVGWLIVISESVAVIYREGHYEFNALQTGLVYISPFVGGILGTAVAGKVSDVIVKAMARRNGGLYEPEFRLVMALPVAITTVIGLMGFGWSAQLGDHWIVPTVFFGVVSFGCSLGSTTSITFCVDSYRQYAGEALVTLNFSKNIFHGLVFSLFVTGWLTDDGPKTVFIWIGIIQLILLFLTIPMYIYGKRARMWTVRKNFMEKF